VWRKFALTRGDGFAFERGYFSWPGEHVELHGIAVADDWKAMMDSGELAPGDKLPGEAEMAELYGVSRDTIRRATQELCLASLRYAPLCCAGTGLGGGADIASMPAPSLLLLLRAEGEGGHSSATAKLD